MHEDKATIDARTRRKAEAHDDYLAACRAMLEIQRGMSVKAQRGDEFARGYVAALHMFSLQVQASLARRIG